MYTFSFHEKFRSDGSFAVSIFVCYEPHSSISIDLHLVSFYLSKIRNSNALMVYVYLCSEIKRGRANKLSGTHLQMTSIIFITLINFTLRSKCCCCCCCFGSHFMPHADAYALNTLMCVFDKLISAITVSIRHREKSYTLEHIFANKALIRCGIGKINDILYMANK